MLTKGLKLSLAILSVTAMFSAPVSVPVLSITGPAGDELRLPQETHLRNVKQLTFGGENAEAYFSADGKQLIFQSTREGKQCDQIYTMSADGTNVRMISTGTGRTTCSYFFPNGRKILYSSTHLGGLSCVRHLHSQSGWVTLETVN
jgi:hypothetical protein